MDRRNFITSALASLPVVGLAAAVGAAPPRRPPERPEPMPPSHPTHAAAIRTLDAALDALDDFGESCCGEEMPCSLCLDADGVAFAMYPNCCMLEGEFVGGRRSLSVDPPDVEASDPRERCVLALYDALDALLDASAFHCPVAACHICVEADRGLYAVRQGLAAFTCSGLWTPRTAERGRLSAARKIDRLARVGTDESLWLAHAWNEHHDAERQLQHAAELVAAVEVSRS